MIDWLKAEVRRIGNTTVWSWEGWVSAWAMSSADCASRNSSVACSLRWSASTALPILTVIGSMVKFCWM